MKIVNLTQHQFPFLIGKVLTAHIIARVTESDGYVVSIPYR